MDAMQHDWWLYLILGIGLVVLGLIAISVPFFATLAALTVIGVLFIVGAVVQAVHAFKVGGGASRIFFGLVLAFLYLIAGLVLLAHPIAGMLWVTVLLAIYFFVQGIVRIMMSIEKRLPNWGWMLFGGVLSLILGFLILAWFPGSAIWMLGLLLGVDLLVGGVTIVALSVAVHSAMPAAPRLAGQH